MLLCRRVDERQGAYTLHRVGNLFRLREIPGRLPSFVVFLQVTNGVGDYELSVELLDLASGETNSIGNVGRATLPDRLTLGSIMIAVPPLPVENAAKHDLIVLANGEEVDRRELHVEPLERAVEE